MSDIFIDGGGNWRHIVDRYLKLAKFDEVYVFEPNPIFHDSYNNSGYNLIKKAIWTKNGHMPFYISKDENQVASSLLKEKLCKVDSKKIPYWHDQPIEVECIDFSKWISQFNELNNIILKLDIEGSEYDVLWKMIKDGSINRVNKLYVEFHSDTIFSKKKEENELIAALRSYGIEPLEWD